MQLIFQDPHSSLNPRMTVKNIIAEPLLLNGVTDRRERTERVEELMRLVGLRVEYMPRFPHAFSGGQRQRIGIARALALNPRLVVADEPVSALDVSVQAQILNLLLELQERMGLTYLFVSHDLSVVKHISDRVAVMYVGQMVEMGERDEVFSHPQHPYTAALLASVPKPDPRQRSLRDPLPGEVANPAEPPSGCYFHPRCEFATERCKVERPIWEEISPGHFVRCHRARELDSGRRCTFLIRARGDVKENDALRARRLRCEHAIDPLGVDVARPALSWIPDSDRGDETQTSYQILISGTPDGPDHDRGDIWDSGRVSSDVCEGVPYDGRALMSRERCWWKVRLWDRDRHPGPWSEAAVFEMGLLHADDWRARWIGTRAGVSSPLLRTEFTVDAAPRRARAYVSGLGYCELRLNGAKVGDHVLDPAPTTYDHDPDLPFTHELHPRVLYVVYDIADRVRMGPNAVGLMLGHGWFSSEPGVGSPPAHHKPFGDRPRALVMLEIELETGERVLIDSDPGWRASSGPVTYNDYYHGERYDARLEQPGWDLPGFDETGWVAADELEPLAGALRVQPLPPIRVIETVEPVGMTHPRTGVTVADFGQNMPGWTKIAASGAPGTEVTLRHAARVDAHGELDDRSNMAREWGSYEARQTDTYVLNGDGVQTWEPRFTLHGFRHVEVAASGPISLERIEGRVVHSALESIGEFECSDGLLNQIHQNVRWTFRASLQGFPQDAADRSERVGWLGDPGFIVEDLLHNFDMYAFYAKWLDDLHDAQRTDGNLPTVAPLQWRGPIGSYRGCPDWKATYPLIVWHLYRFSGDRSPAGTALRGDAPTRRLDGVTGRRIHRLGRHRRSHGTATGWELQRPTGTDTRGADVHVVVLRLCPYRRADRDGAR